MFISIYQEKTRGAIAETHSNFWSTLNQDLLTKVTKTRLPQYWSPDLTHELAGLMTRLAGLLTQEITFAGMFF